MIEGNEKSANLPGLPECEEDQSAWTAGNSPSSRVERPDNQADDLLCFATPQANHVDEEQGGSSKYTLTTSEQDPISFGEDAQGEWQHRQESNSAIDLHAKVRSGVRSIQRAGQRLLGGLIFGRNTWTDDSLPVPQIEPDILEEDVFDAFKVNPYTEDCRSQGWKCIGVSAIGSNHIIRQEPCQDPTLHAGSLTEHC